MPYSSSDALGHGQPVAGGERPALEVRGIGSEVVHLQVFVELYAAGAENHGPIGSDVQHLAVVGESLDADYLPRCRILDQARRRGVEHYRDISALDQPVEGGEEPETAASYRPAVDRR